MSVTLHTSLGNIKLELEPKLCPKTVKNFLALCATGYYNKTLFHRSIPGFMVQGGDPSGTGKGGESIWGKKFEDEIDPSLRHDKGVISMANSGPHTNMSQFFFTYAANRKYLDNRYTVFGRIIDGMETLEKMEKIPTNAKDRPTTDIVLEMVTIHSNPLADAERV
eukprot:TRINITY_DN179747_c0_g1_i1.p1 TRINITY_DN179747_c0_g1~~TRINITY_DN179747_c0_g1_i1.p1  ORF type:complete len:165 (+),score=37.06 TRINITY_DN179747_c0_g1_i1:98-592(+)